MSPKYFQFIKPTKNSNDCNFSLIFVFKYTNKRGSPTLLKIRYMTHELYMRKALEEASLAEEEGEIPVGAIVVCKGKIIARAHNQTERLNDVTAHAEMVAITMAAAGLGGKYLNECTLYVTLEPCTMCAGAMAWAQLGELVYGASDPQRGFSRLSPAVLHPRTKITSGILEPECSEPVKRFFQKRR